MNKENQRNNLLDVIGESKYINPDSFFDVLARTPREKSLLPWGRLSEDRLPLEDILKDMHREQGMEALYAKGVVSDWELKRFREDLLKSRLECLSDGSFFWPIKLQSSDPALIRDEARLYTQCIEAYLDRKNRYERGIEIIRQDLEYIEILAGKIACSFPGLGLSEEYDREVLEMLLEIYSKGQQDVTENVGLPAEQHTAKARQARKEIDSLYPLRE